jgi:hypothetical protein
MELQDLGPSKMIAKPGYHKLSSFMVDKQYAIFRKFKILANRDLLYLQAQLAHLEAELSVLSDRDGRTAGEEEELYDTNWYLLSSSADREHDGQQWEKVLQIRAKLKEYCTILPASYHCEHIFFANLRADESLSRYSDIIKKPQARKRDVEMLKKWISRGDLGGGIPFSGNDLNLVGGSVYDDTSGDDLVILNNRAGEDDTFTRFLAGPVFHKLERLLRYTKVSNFPRLARSYENATFSN